MADVFRETHLHNLNALMEKTGYNIVQENGQRKYGPPPGWIGPPPPKGSEIFIGKLPRDVFELELVPLCEQFGKIYELRLMMDYNGENRGYAFVTFTNNEDASKAIKGLDDYEIRPNRHIGVCKSVDNCRLFIGGIPKDKSKEEILNEISKYTEGVSKVILYSCITDKTKNRGFAFVEYESHRAAAMARRKLISSNIKLFDHEIAVDWAQPEAQVEDETMKRVKVLYVRNLSPLTSEDQLHRLFSMGGVLRVERVKKMRDFAFIHYCRREDAENALKQIDGCVLDGCTLEVTWAKPPETQKQRLPTDKRDSFSNIYKQLTYDALDHSFDLGLSPNSPVVPGFPLISRNMKSRLPLHTIPSFKNSFPITRPIQLLNYICLENGWGEPVYNVSCVESDPSELFFVCSILIPGFPPLARKFMSDKVCRSPDEAKYNAASYVLKKLSITDTDGHTFPTSLNASNALTSFSKNYAFGNSTMTSSKPVNNLGFYSPQKNFPVQSYNKIQDQISSFFNERGQGDASFLSNTHSLDGNNFDDAENCTPLLDPNTPIEPNSILGLLASVAAASNVDLPLFNKPKL